MRYVYFGTPRFASLILAQLIDCGAPPVAVVCNPDRPQGRRNILTPPLVKQLLARVDPKGVVPILQPETLTSDELIATLRNLNPDVFLLAAYGKILPKEIFSVPLRGTVVVHPSLLPKHRGATPIQTAILNGDAETGTTLFVMDEQVDHGPILGSRTIAADSMAYDALEAALAAVSAELVLEILPRYVVDDVMPKEQDHAAATLTKKFMAEDAKIDTKTDDPIEIERKVRALNPEPGTWTIRDGKRVKLLAAEFDGDALYITKFQTEGKMPTELRTPIRDF